MRTNARGTQVSRAALSQARRVADARIVRQPVVRRQIARSIGAGPREAALCRIAEDLALRLG
jgi:hypothetical protein